MSATPLPLRYRFQTKVLGFVFLMIVADVLFYDAAIGISAALFGAFALAVLIVTHPGVLRHRGACAVLVLCVGLLGAFVWSPGLLSLSLFALGCATLLLLPRRRVFDPWLWVRDMLGVPASLLLQQSVDRRKINKLQSRKKTKQVYSSLLGYILFPLVFAIAFVFFFAKVNPAWESVLAYIDILALLRPGRWAFWLVAGFVIWGFLRLRLLRSRTLTTVLPFNLESWVSRTSLVLSLCLFNVMFAVQNGMDLNTFFHATEIVNYASRAQNAAYPLIFTVMLAAFYVLLVFDERQAKYHSVPAKYLTVFWIGQNILLTLTAAYRNGLYIEAFSLTALRLSAMIWMGLIAVGLVLIIGRLVLNKSNAWLVKGNLLALFSVLYICCFVNFDRLIVEYNFAHSLEGGVEKARVFDMRYALKIGAPALPVLKKVYEVNQSGYVLKEMRYKYVAFVDPQQGDWRAWTLSRYFLEKDLSGFADFLKEAEQKQQAKKTLLLEQKNAEKKRLK